MRPSSASHTDCRAIRRANRRNAAADSSPLIGSPGTLGHPPTCLTANHSSPRRRKPRELVLRRLGIIAGAPFGRCSVTASAAATASRRAPAPRMRTSAANRIPEPGSLSGQHRLVRAGGHRATQSAEAQFFGTDVRAGWPIFSRGPTGLTVRVTPPAEGVAPLRGCCRVPRRVCSHGSLGAAAGFRCRQRVRVGRPARSPWRRRRDGVPPPSW